MKSLMEIFVDFSFDAAHYLPNVPPQHKCGRMHGHTYRLRLYFSGPVNPLLGWVIDYAHVKVVADQILSQLDHHTLNDVPGLENPTCELIAQWIADRLDVVTWGGAFLTAIDLRETERAGVHLTILFS